MSIIHMGNLAQHNIRSYLTNSLAKIKENRFSLAEARYEKKLLQTHQNEQLLEDEIQQIKKRWQKLIPISVKRGFPFYRGIKSINGFNADYLPSSFYAPYILNLLNPINTKKYITHKSLSELLYGDIIKHPKTIFRSVGGRIFDEKYQPVSLDTVGDYISNTDSPLLFKQAFDSSQGLGVKLFKKSEKEILKKTIYNSVYYSAIDFIIQELVEQSQDTKIFNPTSLNCFRITTISFNNEIFIGSRALKCGPENSVVDNIGSGKRGVIVGIKDSGKLADFGFYGNGEKTNSHNGILFKDSQITAFPRLLETAIALHQCIPHFGIVGWDLALDKHNDPVLIEGNVIYPGIVLEQICSGPIFGNHTDEVIDYLIFRSNMGGVINPYNIPIKPFAYLHTNNTIYQLSAA